jgi:periodic tryptophan protein 2
MTARLYAVDRSDFEGACLSGHSNHVIGAWFSQDSKHIYTVSKDGSLFEWEMQTDAVDVKQMPKKQKSVKERKVMRWKSKNRFYFNQNHAKVVCASFYPPTGLLSVGFDSGIFGIWELPDFTNIHTLR